jgi:hypothetical protein
MVLWFDFGSEEREGLGGERGEAGAGREGQKKRMRK